MSKPYYVQVQLDHNNTHTVCWVEAKKELKVGSRVTLADSPDIWWDVKRIYSDIKVHKDAIKSDWHVGGL